MSTKTAHILLALALLLAISQAFVAQNGGGHILYGDFKVDESKVTGLKPLSFDLILYTTGGDLVARQTVTNNSRYRFIELPNGDYDLVVEVEGNEIARIRVMLNESFKTDTRRDVELEWRENLTGKTSKPGISSADVYKRTSTNEKRFAKAETAINEKRYSEAADLLLQILNEDGKDYQIWTELGTVYLMQKDFAKAEGAYERAGEVNPSFFPPFFNLGKLRMAEKRFELAIEPLNQSVKLRPNSVQANYLLGEAYLQIKQGSKAVIYLNEALKLDPYGMAQIHLRLAVLYNAAGMKSKAAEEYEAFLKKRPEYPDRKTLEQYISENKKQ
ncbi:MAG TPA: tetratricopeptide repeat protein [Pyrinomonadaceae bacterium]